MPDKTSSSKSITVSIVSHGQQALILPLLEQLERLCQNTIAKVVVTVNIPECDQLVQRADGLPIEKICNGLARGFGANHNAAFEHCNTDWFLVLNPDMRFEADVLTPMLAFARPDDGVLAPRIFEPGQTAPEPHRAVLTPREILTRHNPSYIAPRSPAWIPGMFMLFRAEVYRSIRGFDERYFMYGEDFDICARLKLAGWKIGVVEQHAALHDARRASHRSLRHLWWHACSLTKVWMSRAFWRYRKLASS